MTTIHIKNLKLHTLIGINAWEKEQKQEVFANITINFDGTKACETDDIKDTLDYDALTKLIINRVENSSFLLLERLVKTILNIITENPLVETATVCVDKPKALEVADSVSITLKETKTCSVI